MAASGGVIKGGSPATPEAIVKRTEDWQVRTLAYAKVVPEMRHAALFVNNTMSLATIDIDGDDRIARIMAPMLSSFPMGRVCRNLFLVGEIVVAFNIRTQKWEAYGKEDFKYADKKPLEVKQADGKFRPLGNDWRWFRIWREDDSDRFRAMSCHEPMLDLCESMYLHQLADAAVAQSRLAGAGILFIPNDEFTDIPVEDGGEPEPGTQQHFEDRLRGAMAGSIADRSQQDAIVPLVMFGSAELADSIKHILMERKDDAKGFYERMSGYADRYGNSIDLPKEVIAGMGQTNHWAAWKVDQNTWQYYLRPLGQVVVDALTLRFIRPVAQELGSSSLITAKINAQEVIVKPDKTDAAIRLHSTNALSAEAALRETGFDPETDLHPLANQGNGSLGMQPDGAVRMPDANFRGSEGEPIGDRNVQR